MTEATEVSEKERVDQAFRIVIEAIDLAMVGKFPIGINFVEDHLRVKGALQVISGELLKVYPPEPEQAPAETEEPECRMGEPEVEEAPEEPVVNN